MAATRLMPIHVHALKGVGLTVADCIDYGKNPEKTNEQKFISSFGCDTDFAAAQMLQTLNQYQSCTGKNFRGKDDVALYQIRQSFAPGETTPEEALMIGNELAHSLTKGRHQYIVCTHVDHKHIHNHIYFCAVPYRGPAAYVKKFRNFFLSGRAVARISDKLCLQHGLSIIENPERGKHDYGTWLGNRKPLTNQDRLRIALDEALEKKPKNLTAVIDELKANGYEVKQGKQLAFRLAGSQKFTRLRSLGDGYSEDDIKDRISGKREAPRKAIDRKKARSAKPGLLINVQAEMQNGKGRGYARWAARFNIRQMQQTMEYLKEHGYKSYEEFAADANPKVARYNQLSGEHGELKELERKMAANRELHTQIINFAKTKSVFDEYKASHYSNDFYAAHEGEIDLHRASKSYFSAMGYGGEKKLPRSAALQTEYTKMSAERKRLSAEFKECRDVVTIKKNVDIILGHENMPETELNARTQNKPKGKTDEQTVIPT